MKKDPWMCKSYFTLTTTQNRSQHSFSKQLPCSKFYAIRPRVLLRKSWSRRWTVVHTTTRTSLITKQVTINPFLIYPCSLLTHTTPLSNECSVCTIWCLIWETVPEDICQLHKNWQLFSPCPESEVVVNFPSLADIHFASFGPCKAAASAGHLKMWLRDIVRKLKNIIYRSMQELQPQSLLLSYLWCLRKVCENMGGETWGTGGGVPRSLIIYLIIDHHFVSLV